MLKYLAILMLLAAAPAVAQSQADMTAAAVKDFKEADAQLNTVYKQLTAKLPPNVKAKLRLPRRPGWSTAIPT